MHVRDQLQLRDVSTVEVVAAVEGLTDSKPIVTPGGRWVAAATEAPALAFVDAKDGSAAGSIPLPDGWTRLVDCDVDPAGRNLAETLLGPRGDTIIAVYDLATGGLAESIRVTFLAAQRQLAGGVRWVGRRRLNCNGVLVDLALKAALCDWRVGDGGG